MILILTVIIVLIIPCLFTLNKSARETGSQDSCTVLKSKKTQKKAEISKRKNKVAKTPPARLRYCLKCYTLTRPKDLICRECGEILQSDRLEAFDQDKKVRYCVNCYTPCKPKAVVCEACGYVIRPDYRIKIKNSDKKIRYCVNCYIPCQEGDVICNHCGYEFYR